MSLLEHGAQHCSKVDSGHLRMISDATESLPQNKPGIRLHGIDAIRGSLSHDGTIGKVVADAVGDQFRPVRAIFFDKSQDTNWNLGWHQDRTICVKEKREVDGFGPWTIKAGMPHVAPPFELLSRMLTIRVHLDDVSASNAPLLIAPRSHKKGLVPVDQIDSIVSECGVFACFAQAGDIWIYSTPILHASDKAIDPNRRRVLQVDFSPDSLPEGLNWMGV